MTVVELPGFVANLVSWLRAGYPEGLPPHDYVALLALLRRRLSDDEVAQVVEGLIRDGDVRDGCALRDAITEITNEPPLDTDVERVNDRLASVGWPGKLFDHPVNFTSAPEH